MAMSCARLLQGISTDQANGDVPWLLRSLDSSYGVANQDFSGRTLIVLVRARFGSRLEPVACVLQQIDSLVLADG